MPEILVKSDLGTSDLIAKLDGAKKLTVLKGSEDNSWKETIAWDPVEEFSSSENRNLNKELEAYLEKNRLEGRISVGFISYDYGYVLRKVKRTKNPQFELPNICFYSFDNYIERTNAGYKIIYRDSSFVKNLSKLLRQNSEIPKTNKISFKANIGNTEYAKNFDKAKTYIKKGHVYQINLAHNLQANSDENSRAIFTRLATTNKARMMSYFEGDGFEISSMSPERFIRTSNRHIETLPIKGTRARLYPKRDDQVIADLMTNQKELSELSMITDLLRNDLSIVCEPGSVRLEKQRDIQILSNVIHTYSKIAGVLKNDVSPIDALLSMFPGGSITGCPKKRAMEIIDELEPVSRGVYCGCMVKIDPSGDLDSSILIRTLIKKDNQIILPVGGGIVFDSVDNEEYQETLDKSLSLTNALTD